MRTPLLARLGPESFENALFVASIGFFMIAVFKVQWLVDTKPGTFLYEKLGPRASRVVFVVLSAAALLGSIYLLRNPQVITL
jgi:hypothetical protein